MSEGGGGHHENPDSSYSTVGRHRQQLEGFCLWWAMLFTVWISITHAVSASWPEELV